jgi:hypothetical protein
MSSAIGLKKDKLTAELKDADKRIKLARKGDYIALLKFIDNNSVSPEDKYSSILELLKITNSRQVGFRGLEYLISCINSKYSGEERRDRMRAMLKEIISQQLNSPMVRKAALAELERIG